MIVTRLPKSKGRVSDDGSAFFNWVFSKRYYPQSALVSKSLHHILHTFSLETELQYFVLDSLGAEV